ncbi:PQQ-binding-like beta-propeller repeat protein [bacterium]|nr:PQQ-binding-like beta-propeller repeat protein [bacterium]
MMLLGSSQVAIHTKRRGDGQALRRSVMAADRKTGEALWRKDVSVEALVPLVVSNDSVLYQTDKRLVCLSLESGDQKWSVAHPCRLGNAWQWAAPTLVARDGIAYVADFQKLSAFSADDGEPLWSSSAAAGFCSPPDIFVIDGLVWRGYTRSRGSADFGQGLDARTGKVSKTIDTKKAWDYATLAHHR